MGAMKITQRLDFAAAPSDVVSMMLDPAFLSDVCAASEAVSHTVTIDGSTSTATRVLTAPSAARPLTGDSISLTEVVDWGTQRPDGTYAGTLDLTAKGLPVTLVGTAQVRPGGRGTTVDFDAELTVKLPFIGKKVEQTTAPAVIGGLEIQQRLGNAYLAAR